jgi:hypothetical protein
MAGLISKCVEKCHEQKTNRNSYVQNICHVDASTQEDCKYRAYRQLWPHALTTDARLVVQWIIRTTMGTPVGNIVQCGSHAA